MDNIVIQVHHVTKTYGEIDVLKDVSLKLEKGKIYGLIGRNGSGKTMLMKTICGFVSPTKGKVIVQGKELGRDIDIPKKMGVIIEQPGFLPGYSAYANLLFLSRINGTIDKTDILNALNQVGLGNTGKKKVGKFSMGMRQRLGLAQALLEKPDILILDEPMNGLDDRAVDEIRQLLLKEKQRGVTIIIASHNREDIEMLCDQVFQMENGKLVS